MPNTTTSESHAWPGLADMASEFARSVGALAEGASPSVIAEPLVKALEASPVAGRVAAIQRDAQGRFSVLSAPSFSAQELRAVEERLASEDCLPRLLAGQTVCVDGAHGVEADCRLLAFPLSVPGESPPVVLVMARAPEAHPQEAELDDFIAQLTRLAGVVLEDRRLREELLARQSILAAIMRTVPDAIIRIDSDGMVLDFLGRAERLFGWSAKDIVGQSLTRLMPKEHGERHAGYIARFLRTGERRLPDFGRRLLGCRKDGSTFPIEIALSEIHTANGVEFLGLVRDISRRVDDEHRMEELREAMETASRQSALGEFAASVAHELNQPLAAIATYMDALDLQLSKLDAEACQALRATVRKAGDQARLGGEIIRRMGRMTRRSAPASTPGDFHAAVSEAAEILRMPALRARVTLIVEHEGEDGRASFDRVQVQQIVTNLASNAFAAMRGSERRALTLRSIVRADEIELQAEDTGPGVPETERERIFESFVSRNPGGSGLGLAIVRRIAQSHGGRVWVEEAEGGGARFRLVMPRRPAQAGA